MEMLKQAYDLLVSEYQQCRRIVAENEHLLLYANEKDRHSLQVAGAGNYLLCHINEFKSASAEKLNIVKTAILLHDIGRFAEIEHLLNNQHGYDHGVQGAEFLQKIPLFNNIKIWLPIKHHGHLIEDLYQDELYLGISDKSLQEEIKHICFVIRDADKIANLNMLTQEKNIWPLFFGTDTYCPQTDGVISPEVYRQAFMDMTIRREDRKTAADFCVSYIAWLKDINYRAAIDYCNKLNILPRLHRVLDLYCSDTQFKQEYMAHIKKYVKEHQFLD